MRCGEKIRKVNFWRLSMGEFRKVKKGGKGTDEEEAAGENSDGVHEVGAWLKDGATGNDHAEIPEKRRRGRLPKKAVGHGGKIDSYLIKVPGGDGDINEGFVTKSKLSHTPFKKGLSKKEGKEKCDEKNPGKEDGDCGVEKIAKVVGEGQANDNGSAVDGGAGDVAKEKELAAVVLAREALSSATRGDDGGKWKKKRNMENYQEKEEEDADDPSEIEEEKAEGARADESSDDGFSDSSARAGVGSGLGKHWFVAVRKAEESLKREMRRRFEDFEKRSTQRWQKNMKKMYEESEGNMKRWFYEEINKVKEECLVENDNCCEYCEQSREEARELRSRVKEIRENAERERKRWEEERRRLENIVAGKESAEREKKRWEEENRRFKSIIERRESVERERKRWEDECGRLKDIIDGREKNGGTKGTERRKIRREEKEENGYYDSISEASIGNSTGNARDVGGKATREEERLRQLMERKPRPLNDRELKEEKGKREYRKNNISVYFPEGEGAPTDRIWETIAEKCGYDVRGKTMKKYEGGGMVVARYKDWYEKLEMMKRKRELKGTDIWIKNDLTKREKDVQKWL